MQFSTVHYSTSHFSTAQFSKGVALTVSAARSVRPPVWPRALAAGGEGTVSSAFKGVAVRNNDKKDTQQCTQRTLKDRKRNKKMEGKKDN